MNSRILRLVLVLIQVLSSGVRASSSPSSAPFSATDKLLSISTASQTHQSSSDFNLLRTSGKYTMEPAASPATSSSLNNSTTVQIVSSSGTSETGNVTSSSSSSVDSATSSTDVSSSPAPSSPSLSPSPTTTNKDISSSTALAFSDSSAPSLLKTSGTVSQTGNHPASQTPKPSAIQTDASSPTRNQSATVKLPFSSTSNRSVVHTPSQATWPPTNTATSATSNATNLLPSPSLSPSSNVSVATEVTQLTSVPSTSVIINWTDWSAAPADCEEFCSNVGGTITASRQCFTSSATLSKEECAKYSNETLRVFSCDEQCDMSSGPSVETLTSHLSIIASCLSLLM